MSLPPEDDPHGDRAWLEQRRQRGRGAILEAEHFTEDDDAGDEFADRGERDEDDGDGGLEGEAEQTFDHVRIPRLFGSTIRNVPVSMPEDAPITCLGKMGRLYYYLTPLGELVALQDSEHGQAHIAGLWAPKLAELRRAFPQFDQQRKFKGFQAHYARDAMIEACAAKGLFDAHKRVRGLGCWRADDGQLVQHLGDRVLVGKKEFKPGEIDGYVYPGRPAMAPPVAGGKLACTTIYERFQRWNFERGEVDARLLLGQVAAGVLGAAIDWRPMGFLTGDAGTGKSTLQRLIRQLHPERIISTVDASEAALRALLGQDALCVSFDEIEADAHNDKAQAVMKLARTSASGDDAHRSGQDQVARSFTLRGSFLFSAIVPPSMRQQDMQRFAFLRLNTLPKGSKLPPLSDQEHRALGQGMVGRITEGWPRWERTLSAYFQALQERGHEHRGAMQFGTMLAAAHVLLHDADPEDEDLSRWCDPLHRDKLFEYENSAPAWLNIWRHIMSSSPDVWRSHGSPTVADVVRQALQADQAQDGQATFRARRSWLAQTGLWLARQQKTGRWLLAVAPKHQGLNAIFRGTDFEAKGGEGAWNLPLRGAPKIDGDRGVLHVENVPALGRQKCPLFWLGGSAQLAGQWEPIFDAGGDDWSAGAGDEDRAGVMLAAIAGATSTADLERINTKGLQLRAELADGDEAAQAMALRIDDAFNAKWIAIEDAAKAAAQEAAAGGGDQASPS